MIDFRILQDDLLRPVMHAHVKNNAELLTCHHLVDSWLQTVAGKNNNWFPQTRRAKGYTQLKENSAERTRSSLVSELACTEGVEKWQFFKKFLASSAASLYLKKRLREATDSKNRYHAPRKNENVERCCPSIFCSDRISLQSLAAEESRTAFATAVRIDAKDHKFFDFGPATSSDNAAKIETQTQRRLLQLNKKKLISKQSTKQSDPLVPSDRACTAFRKITRKMYPYVQFCQWPDRPSMSWQSGLPVFSNQSFKTRGGARGCQDGHCPPKILPAPQKNFQVSFWKSYTDHWELPLLQNWPLQWPPNENVSLRPCSRPICQLRVWFFYLCGRSQKLYLLSLLCFPLFFWHFQPLHQRSACWNHTNLRRRPVQ